MGSKFITIINEKYKIWLNPYNHFEVWDVKNKFGMRYIGFGETFHEAMSLITNDFHGTQATRLQKGA